MEGTHPRDLVARVGQVDPSRTGLVEKVGYMGIRRENGEKTYEQAW